MHGFSTLDWYCQKQFVNESYSIVSKQNTTLFSQKTTGKNPNAFQIHMALAVLIKNEYCWVYLARAMEPCKCGRHASVHGCVEFAVGLSVSKWCRFHNFHSTWVYRCECKFSEDLQTILSDHNTRTVERYKTAPWELTSGTAFSFALFACAQCIAHKSIHMWRLVILGGFPQGLQTLMRQSLTGLELTE